ncbi:MULTISPECIES: nucleotide exchange factor GrpE [Bacillaceae]|uniref:Protein GrpE n=1 Tax=Domibacillus aminovorans TaxID=29332 RepID=A0A177KSY5_9BACI|nr:MULTISPECIES: nucleotide exchange factor GrpE [Bacillaceae]OAH56065.1 molecular chaperone GrpE [Domibacillus aminovorans]
MAEEQKPLTVEDPVQQTESSVEEEQVEVEETVGEEIIEEVTEEVTESKEEVLQKQLDEAEERYLRLRADFENFRRRANLDREAQEKYRAQRLVTDLLPVLDNFERALQVTPEQEETKSVLQGVEMVYKTLVAALESEGVEPIEAAGHPFDPTIHQAVMTESDENAEPNSILAELQKGYKLKDRVIRPSMVKVNQ